MLEGCVAEGKGVAGCVFSVRTLKIEGVWGVF